MTRVAVDPTLVERFRACMAALAPELTASIDRIGVAVSGGPDSLAALLLAVTAFPGRVAAISIDHRLRAEAAGECASVAALCTLLDVPHETIRVIVDPSRGGLQAAARSARREAWRTWAMRRGMRWIVVGHHADDQAETVLMRLARGAGVGGLSGIPPASRLAGTPDAAVRLLRPLLGWSRRELADLVRAAGVEPADDPSNRDARFDRTRFRALLATTDLLPARRLSAAADHLRDADIALDWMVDRIAAERLNRTEGRVHFVPDELPFELLRRLAGKALAHLAAHPDGSDIAAMIRLLQSGRTATLAGIKAVPRNGKWTFTPAPPRRTY